MTPAVHRPGSSHDGPGASRSDRRSCAGRCAFGQQVCRSGFRCSVMVREVDGPPRPPAPKRVVGPAASFRQRRWRTGRTRPTRSNASFATPSTTSGQNGLTGGHPGVPGGRKCNRTLAGTTSRLALCQPASSGTSTFAPSGSARAANAVTAPARSTRTRGRITGTTGRCGGGRTCTRTAARTASARPRADGLAPTHPPADRLGPHPGLVLRPNSTAQSGGAAFRRRTRV
jgi:hypothetical protein